METIVASGTKLNLNYAINDMVDEYEQEEIIDYFKSCETSSLQVAQEELADSNFNWEQLKLIRIKFLCEYGIDFATLVSKIYYSLKGTSTWRDKGLV